MATITNSTATTSDKELERLNDLKSSISTGLIGLLFGAVFMAMPLHAVTGDMPVERLLLVLLGIEIVGLSFLLSPSAALIKLVHWTWWLSTVLLGSMSAYNLVAAEEGYRYIGTLLLSCWLVYFHEVIWKWWPTALNPERTSLLTMTVFFGLIVLVAGYYCSR